MLSLIYTQSSTFSLSHAFEDNQKIAERVHKKHMRWDSRATHRHRQKCNLQQPIRKIGQAQKDRLQGSPTRED